tara:strand:- start:8493 stop:8981 length:489 start_codon:yes stop_codon:yes gene_type:complete
MKTDKSKFVDTMGRPITQALFLEIGYSKFAVYTLKEQDHTYKDKVYPSLKRLYLEMCDPVEFDFATEYLLGYRHWQRICENKALASHVAEWREELELKLRSQAMAQMLDMSEDSFQAVKWLADKGWEKKGAGRPATKAKEMEDALTKKVETDYSADIVRLKR